MLEAVVPDVDKILAALADAFGAGGLLGARN
jgi:hypothetical protein